MCHLQSRLQKVNPDYKIRKMLNFLKFNKNKKNSFKEEDELIGVWENDLDDGSGLHAIWGWSFKFNADGTGTYSFWSGRKLENEIPFSWSRIGQNSIRAKYLEDEEWYKIEYSIVTVNAPYSGKLLKLTDNNYKPDELSKEGFWDCFGAIYKPL